MVDYSFIPSHDKEFEALMCDISNSIKKIRIEKNFVQQELAVRAEISETTLSEIERACRKNVTVKVLSKLASACGYELKIIFQKNLQN